MNQEQVYDRIQVLYTEMNTLDQNNAIDIAINALKLQEKNEKTLYHKDLAQYIKQELDSQKGGTWNVIVGQSFGSFVTHETKTKFIFSYLEAWITGETIRTVFNKLINKE